MRVVTHSPQETIEVAVRLGKCLKKGDIIAYRGGLGAGKTTFTRGLAIGLGLGDEVTSPTFALVNEYCGEGLNLYHFDMYRIETEGDLESSGFWDYDFADNIAVIEWSENISQFLPDSAVFITVNALGDTEREIIIEDGGRFDSVWI
ncbi:MAG: tRNA (adenosine(37)-N6)-threonylcarbamoyltransferase complex ATPase subunit type 1 TsaE [Ruminococcus flavefaciens]|nr:tRNA (adenosine(37)-N6)-threonylcarbamoyltransferase complex ATPase subunit type 1 TsaE [Ruminococcus flavefaciens]MCM1229237.1 tRNA (adenosine(37)-N6)-threonylcarbamoyltransferase complex ATPase subunit type 1 TsaE [Ruminococcus flavefaciens]